MQFFGFQLVYSDNEMLGAAILNDNSHNAVLLNITVASVLLLADNIIG